MKEGFPERCKNSIGAEMEVIPHGPDKDHDLRITTGVRHFSEFVDARAGEAGAKGFVIVCRPGRGADLWRHSAMPGELFTVVQACARAGIRFDNE